MNIIGVLITVTVFLTIHTFIMKMFKSVEKYKEEEKLPRPPAVVNTKLMR